MAAGHWIHPVEDEPLPLAVSVRTSTAHMRRGAFIQTLLTPPNPRAIRGHNLHFLDQNQNMMCFTSFFSPL